MRLTILINCAGTLLALAVASLLWGKIRGLEQEHAKLQSAVKLTLVADPGEPVELSDVMGKLERHASKLYFSGRAGNWPLAGFYLEEVEETVEGLSRHNIMEGQVNVGAFMKALLATEVKRLEAAVKAEDREGFLREYHSLTRACNACHAATEHSYVMIQEPSGPMSTVQRFEVVPVLPVSGGGE